MPVMGKSIFKIKLLLIVFILESTTAQSFSVESGLSFIYHSTSLGLRFWECIKVRKTRNNHTFMWYGRNLKCVTHIRKSFQLLEILTQLRNQHNRYLTIQ